MDEVLDKKNIILKLIDWGRSIDMSALKGHEFIGRAGTEDFDCFEMLVSIRWKFAILNKYFWKNFLQARSCFLLKTCQYSGWPSLDLSNGLFWLCGYFARVNIWSIHEGALRPKCEQISNCCRNQAVTQNFLISCCCLNHFARFICLPFTWFCAIISSFLGGGSKGIYCKIYLTCAWTYRTANHVLNGLQSLMD